MKELIKVSKKLNKKPLPAIKSANGLRIPQNASSLLQAKYKLKTDLVFFSILLLSHLISYFYKHFFFLQNKGKNVLKKNTKITVAEMLNATKQTKAVSNPTQCNYFIKLNVGAFKLSGIIKHILYKIQISFQNIVSKFNDILKRL